MLCPRCEQDHVISATLKANDTRLVVCPECEASWFSLEDVGVNAFFDYGTYMEGIGLTGLWTELEILPG